MAELPTVLLIDPSERSREVLAERLRMQGYAVTIASDGAEGAHAALSSPPAAVVADLTMPSISGVQLCRLLRAEPATAGVPVILRGPDGPRNRFWAERAGAVAYVTQGRMGDLVRALARAIAESAEGDGFFTALPTDGSDIRDRIAQHLDAALFESVIAAEVRKLGVHGAIDRLFDLFTQFASQVTGYRWLALSVLQPVRLGLHVHPSFREQAEREARAALGVPNAPLMLVEDEDARGDGPSEILPIVEPVLFGETVIGHLALAPSCQDDGTEVSLARVFARELGGPIRMATLMEQAQQQATTDPLTSLMNRRAFVAAVEREIQRADRLGHALSLALVDVDHFKQVNDQRGHAAGDAVLSTVAHVLGREARKVDVVGRWGGEEFVVCLTGADVAGAIVACERLRHAIRDARTADPSGGEISVTASIGCARWRTGETLEAVMDRADRAMYAAKIGGRDRVMAEPNEPEPILAPNVARA